MTAWLKKIPLWMWVVAGFLLLNALTFDWYTTVWMDEAMFADPAANLYFGHGFTSTAWATQSSGEFWAGNTPLYSFLLFVWFKIAGFGIFQTRILDYLLWSGAVALVCLGVQRLNLVRRPLLLAALAAMLFCVNGVVFSYRSGRYDSLIFFAAAVCFFCFTISKPGLRKTAIVISAVFLLPTALILGPFAATLGFLLLLFFGRKIFGELCCLAFGLAAGLGLLALFYGELGLWHAFRHAAGFLAQIYYPEDPTKSVWLEKLAAYPEKAFHDVTIDALLLCLVGLAIFKWKDLDTTGKRLSLLGICVFFVMPVISQAAYAYQIYHRWQVCLPLAVCLAGAAEHCRDAFKKYLPRALAVAAVLFVFVFGLGARLGLAMTDLPERNYSEVESFVKKNVRPSDVVFADYQAFYPLHQLDVRAYYSRYFNVITKPEADAINCLVINPGWLATVEKNIGGQWQATGESDLHENKFGIPWLDRLFPGYFGQQSNTKYNLVIYRRVPANKNAEPASNP